MPGTGDESAFEAVLGVSEAIERMRREALEELASDRPLVLVGEAGTGKKLVARAIHDGGSRAYAPLVMLDCTSLPESVADVALFGRDGPEAREGALASLVAGMLVLGRGGALPAALQTRLLDALDGGAFGGRGDADGRVGRLVVLVTPEHSDGPLVGGLLSRLEAARIDVPPLRKRDGDVRVLARHFVKRLSRERAPRVTDSALRVLERHRWPGNVRELKHVMARALRASDGDAIGREHLEIQYRAWLREGESGEIHIPREGMLLAEIEQEAVRITLQITGGNRSEAARILGISRPTLLRKLRRVQETDQGPWTAG